MSLAYSVFSSEYCHLTAVNLCLNVHKKHSQNHRIPNENREPEAKQQLHVLLSTKSPLCTFIPLSIVMVPASLVIVEIKNESIKSLKLLGVIISNMGMEQSYFTQRASLLIFCQYSYYTSLCSIPVWDTAYPYPN